MIIISEKAQEDIKHMWDMGEDMKRDMVEKVVVKKDIVEHVLEKVVINKLLIYYGGGCRGIDTMIY